MGVGGWTGVGAVSISVALQIFTFLQHMSVPLAFLSFFPEAAILCDLCGAHVPLCIH